MFSHIRLIMAAAVLVAALGGERPLLAQQTAIQTPETFPVSPQLIDPAPQQVHLTEEPGWWTPAIQGPLRPEDAAVYVSVEDLLVRSLQHASQVKVFSELPLIRETSIVEADSAFDWHAFLDSRWDDTSDPVGNSLTVGGGGTRFNDHNLTTSLGARKRTRTGGQFEIAERLGFQDNNSTFFQPDPQGTARLVLSYTQPLMRGRGRVYNESLTVLACIDTDIAKEEFRRQLQSHLLEVVRAYWGLYLERGVYVQKSKAADRAKLIYGRLLKRREIDAYESQLISAEAEVKSRFSELKRSAAAVKNAEDRIRALVNDPQLGTDGIELVPMDIPTHQGFPITMEESLRAAVQCRPEIGQSLKQIKAACVRVNMSKEELMPVLNLVTETYVSGLRGDSAIHEAFGDQFSVGQPSYSIGLQFEVPINNRAARSRHTRRHLELRQLRNQYETTVQTLKLETRVAVREVETSFDELDTKLSAMNAMKAKTDYILRRWELMPGESQSGSNVLEDLLLTQSHLTRAENEYLSAVVTYNLALVNIKRATGMLLQDEQVSISRTCVNCLPTQLVNKPIIERVTPTDSIPYFSSPSMVPPSPESVVPPVPAHDVHSSSEGVNTLPPPTRTSLLKATPVSGTKSRMTFQDWVKQNRK